MSTAESVTTQAATKAHGKAILRTKQNATYHSTTVIHAPSVLREVAAIFLARRCQAQKLLGGEQGVISDGPQNAHQTHIMGERSDIK